jgi:hypothetical protein
VLARARDDLIFRDRSLRVKRLVRQSLSARPEPADDLIENRP